jgi:hypothetical protein
MRMVVRYEDARQQLVGKVYRSAEEAFLATSDRSNQKEGFKLLLPRVKSADS